MCGVLVRVDLADKNFSRRGNEKLLIIDEVYKLSIKFFNNWIILPIILGNIEDHQLVLCKVFSVADLDYHVVRFTCLLNHQHLHASADRHFSKFVVF